MSTPEATLPNRFTAETSFGLFDVKLSNREYITIGTKRQCLQLGYVAETNKAELSWVGTEQGGCEKEDKDIHGNDTVAMTDLGFTILRQLNPAVDKWITLRDSSSFKCELPDGSRVPISLMKYNLLLYGSTYYQRRFHAIPLYDEAIPGADAFVHAWETNPLPTSPPPFKNSELAEILTPLYEQSHSWKEFFQSIYRIYGRKTCHMLHGWYLDVYGSLAKVPVTTDWKIDMAERPVIPFVVRDANNNRNFTRKRYTYDPSTFSSGPYLASLRYKDVRRSTGPGKTRKHSALSYRE